MRIGNFVVKDAWCNVSCKKGHQTRIINISRGHFGVCDKCKTFIFLGSNLSSSWRHEDKKVWMKNNESINGYEWINKDA